MRKQASERIGMLFMMQPPRYKPIMADFSGLRDPPAESSLGLAVLEFLVPGHLDGFELGFVGGGGIAGEARELRDPFVHVREANGERIDVREFVGQADADIIEIVPAEGWRHVWLLKGVFSW